MSTHWEEVWSFETARFRIVGEVTDCDTDPADSFQFDEDIDAVRSGRVAWFDARVRVLLDDEEVGADYLGCCAYRNPEELFRNHASYTRELRKLRRQHASRLSHVEFLRVNRPWRTAQIAIDLADCAKLRREITEILKILRNNASLNPAVSYCEYGPDIVREAIRDARAKLARYASVKLRETA